MKLAKWKIEFKGWTLESLSNGFDRDTDMNDTDPSTPMAVICVSPYLTPSRYNTDNENELMRH